MIFIICLKTKGSNYKLHYQVFYKLTSKNFRTKKGSTTLTYIYLNYFVSENVLSKMLKNLRDKNVLAIYVGRKDVLRSANELPKKICR